MTAGCDNQPSTTATASSTAIGCGLVTLDQGNDILTYDVTRTAFGTGETMAHIHAFSPPGVNSGVQVNLASLGATRKIGSWTHGASNESNVLAGLSYFNMHTGAFAGGEIRGQIDFAQPLASVVPYGAGCIGPGGALSLTANLPWTGHTFSATATGLGPASLGLSVISFNQLFPGAPMALLPIPAGGAGCDLLVATLDLTEILIPAGGVATYNLPLPDLVVDPTLAGLVFYLQVVELDFPAGWVGTYGTNALTCTVGAM